MKNIFECLPQHTDSEELTDLLQRPGIRIERIVSSGQPSPQGFWYDQSHDEWVILLAGRAGLMLEGEQERLLEPGDYVFLPAHCRHRVTWSDAQEPSVWLAVHIASD